MKLDIKLQAGSEISAHQLELPPAAPGKDTDHGELEAVLDGEKTAVNWAETSPRVYSILMGGKSYEAWVTTPPGQDSTRQSSFVVAVGLRRYIVEVLDPRRRRQGGPAAEAGGPQDIVAPMPGKIVKVLVTENQQVRGGEGLLVIEAMKMQNELRALRAGRVEKIYVREGTGVEMGIKLLRLV
jgi:acetyl/propionyl-CoA carboxylase alpha subunit